jgi:ATP-binding cassette, subfamily B, bacterial
MPDIKSERPPGRSLKPLQALWPYLRPYRARLVLALVALVVASGALLTVPVVLRHIVDAGFGNASGATVDRQFSGLLVLAAVLAVFAAARFYLVSSLGERVVADVRKAVYRHVIGMDPAFFEVTQTGEVLSRLTTDTTLIQSIAGVGLSITLRSTLNLVGGLIMLAITNVKLTAFIVTLLLTVVLPLMVVGRRVRRLSRDSQDRVADASALAGETLNAVQVVQAFTLEPLLVQRFGAAVDRAYGTALRRIRVRAALTGVSILFVFTAIAFTIRLGARSVTTGGMSAGELGQFLLYAFFVASAVAALSEMWGEVQRAAGAMERIVELLRSRAHIRTPASPRPLDLAGRGAIAFRHVDFSYPSRPDELALAAFDLDIGAGETVALVGPSGAGKSTTFHVLLRFFDPRAGRILIDGVDIADADPRDVRARIGLVPQDTVVFGTTALENIRYGRPDASDDDVRAAARAAAASGFIEALPEGYDTFLGERGVRLSGGQRQRIAIARALLKNPPILLLDEATSALDAENERLVQEALERLMQDRTTIVIAHRLATVLKVDRIVVMNRGRIVDVGSHGELSARCPLYARLAELQFGTDPELRAPAHAAAAWDASIVSSGAESDRGR